jgi:hypothetical protein
MSVLTLALSNILLPNLLGIEKFASLNQAMAIVSLTCIVFNEAIAYLIIQRVRDQNLVLSQTGGIATQSAIEHSLIGIGALCALFFILPGTNSLAIAAKESWLLFTLSVILVALYIPMVALLTATLNNRLVVFLATINGLLSVTTPLVLDASHLNVCLSIPITYGIGFIACLGIYHAKGVALIKVRPSWDQRIAFRPDLLRLATPTAVRLSVVWLPVLAFGLLAMNRESSTYKIAISIVLGGVSLVPFSKTTMFSIGDKGKGTESASHFATLATMVATVGSLCAIAIAPLFATHVMSPAFGALREILPLVAPYLLLQVMIDLTTVTMLHQNRNGALVTTCVLAVASGATLSAITSWLYLPVLVGSFFIAISMCWPMVRNALLEEGRGVTFISAAIALGLAINGDGIPASAGAILIFVAISLLSPPVRYSALAATRMLVHGR